MLMRIAVPLSMLCWIVQSQEDFPDLSEGWVERDSPAEQFRFYDVTLNTDLCTGSTQELRSEAVDEYIYLGRLLETSEAVSTRMCIQQCLGHSDCVSLNYYKPKSLGETGFCELLADNQWNNPKWMRRYAGAVYYERIECVDSGKSNKFVHHNNAGKNSVTEHFLKSLFNKIADHKRRAQQIRQ